MIFFPLSSHRFLLRRFLLLCTAFTCLLSSAVAMEENPSLQRVLALDEEPFGVVFEIVEGDEEALRELIPRVREAIELIRAKFPATEFAVVSHGREEFALQTKYQEEHAEIHAGVVSLVDSGVPVHVCETHASWDGVTAEDFPDYVDVAPTGPAQIRLYRELDYELVRIE